MIDVKKLYDARFTSFERVRKRKLWKILCDEFLQQFIEEKDTVVDIGAGQCEFVNNIRCKRKIAVDMNKDVLRCAGKDVEVRISSAKRIRNLFEKKSVDVIFMSNLLEHLDNKEDVFRLLSEAYIVLKNGGRLLIMQPDIKLVGNSYWDFFDHKVPITYVSLVEVLLAIEFQIVYTKYPFLPYSTKVRYLPLWPPLFKIYLRFRPAQILFGKQFFICAQK